MLPEKEISIQCKYCIWNAT